MSHPEAYIVDHGIIRNPGDLARLGIVDWHRYKQHWESPHHAIETVGSRFVNNFSFMVVRLNLLEYPQRDDFPGWNHIGDHEYYGKLYWNHFHYVFEGKLHFHDRPDFSGVIIHKDKKPVEWPFWGDIGQVSPITLLDTWRALLPHTMWISVLDEHTQVILEPLVPVDMCDEPDTLAVHHLLRPLDVKWHPLRTSTFIEKDGENVYLGETAHIAKITQSQIQKLVKATLNGADPVATLQKLNHQRGKPEPPITQLPLF
jgi:hypothetical protein